MLHPSSSHVTLVGCQVVFVGTEFADDWVIFVGEAHYITSHQAQLFCDLDVNVGRVVAQGLMGKSQGCIADKTVWGD